MDRESASFSSLDESKHTELTANSLERGAELRNVPFVQLVERRKVQL
jgi:hypothetical protein